MVSLRLKHCDNNFIVFLECFELVEGTLIVASVTITFHQSIIDLPTNNKQMDRKSH